MECAMNCLIVESNAALGQRWQRQLERLGISVTCTQSCAAAQDLVVSCQYDVIVLNLMLADGGALTVADLAYFRQPRANVVFVTDTIFFSDGSIFQHSANTRTLLDVTTPPEDLAKIVHHYAIASRDRAVPQDQALD